MSNLTVLRLPKLGQPAPNLTLPATDGSSIELRTQPTPLVMVFLRHLA